MSSFNGGFLACYIADKAPGLDVPKDNVLSRGSSLRRSSTKSSIVENNNEEGENNDKTEEVSQIKITQ